MTAGYGGEGESLTYDAALEFKFATLQPEELTLTLLTGEGAGFDSLTFTATTTFGSTTQTFNSLSDAEAFFDNQQLVFGLAASGPQDLLLSMSLTASQSGDSFGFAFDASVPEVAGVPETKTWVMMFVGFCGLALAAIVRGRHRPKSSISSTECDHWRHLFGRRVAIVGWPRVDHSRFATPADLHPKLSPVEPIESNLARRLLDGDRWH